jgi:hypothetical protein
LITASLFTGTATEPAVPFEVVAVVAAVVAVAVPAAGSVAAAIAASTGFVGSTAIAGFIAIAASTNAAIHAPLRHIVLVELDLTLFNSIASRATLSASGTTLRILKTDP